MRYADRRVGGKAPNADSARTAISYPWPADAYRSSSSVSAVARQSASGVLAVQSYEPHKGAVCKTVGFSKGHSEDPDVALLLNLAATRGARPAVATRP